MAKTKTSKDLAEAKEKKLPPIVYREDAPENKHLSKAEFVAKRAKEKEKAAKLKQFKADLDKEDAPKTAKK